MEITQPPITNDLEQGPSVPSKANIVGPFVPFPLHAKESLRSN